MLLDLVKTRTSSDTKISIYKTLSWRVIGTLDTMCISYVLTGKLDMALSIGGIEVISKMLLYYLHERTWLKIAKR
ncbi:MAG: DUF2061 domain-containing protein [Crocinitomicaceae bacterium]|jgi:uncharacterized membrane protein|nr:DUF2061 domain-containing protein [Crocinitomicaceae bacterium]